jgi:4a-hydroxytetrahydrobiopterin dehydratase
MNELASMHCSAITANTPKLNAQDIHLYLAELPTWQVYEKDGEPRLEKVFHFKDFTQALDFTNRVAQTVNQEDHHPAILTEWAKVTITWWTHRIRGLHLNDFIMAAKTDQLYGESS